MLVQSLEWMCGVVALLIEQLQKATCTEFCLLAELRVSRQVCSSNLASNVKYVSLFMEIVSAINTRNAEGLNIPSSHMFILSFDLLSQFLFFSSPVAPWKSAKKPERRHPTATVSLFLSLTRHEHSHQHLLPSQAWKWSLRTIARWEELQYFTPSFWSGVWREPAGMSWRSRW